MADAFRVECINSALPQLFSEGPAIFPERAKDIAKKGRLRETIAGRRIEGQLHHFYDLTQTLLGDSRSKKRQNTTVEQQIALYRAWQAR